MRIIIILLASTPQMRILETPLPVVSDQFLYIENIWRGDMAIRNREDQNKNIIARLRESWVTH